jgi:peptidyl-prolyl cis-trans isomerase NIMA-interacting 1
VCVCVYTVYVCHVGKEYYIDPVTKESQWEHPSSTGAGKTSASRKAANGSDQVQVLHILVKHTGSRNPKNYKGETITRSKEEAQYRLDGSYN